MTAPLLTKQTGALIAYGLIFGASAVVGKILIDNFVGDVQDAKARREFIGPVQEAPRGKADQIHVRLSDVVRFVAMGVSVYSTLAGFPELLDQWAKVQASATELIK